MSDIELVKIDISASDAEESATFYGAVLDIEFDEFELGAHAVYQGELSDGTNVAISPDDLTGIDEPGNRIQLNLTVDDVERALEAAVENGGEELEAVRHQGSQRTCTVRDPDGSSLVLVDEQG